MGTGTVDSWLRTDRQGFDFWAARECSHNYFRTHYFRDSPTPIQIETYEPDVQTDLAIEFMRGHREQPFCLVMMWGPPSTTKAVFRLAIASSNNTLDFVDSIPKSDSHEPAIRRQSRLFSRTRTRCGTTCAGRRAGARTSTPWGLRAGSRLPAGPRTRGTPWGSFWTICRLPPKGTGLRSHHH